jgi:hypothetical protein
MHAGTVYGDGAKKKTPATSTARNFPPCSDCIGGVHHQPTDPLRLAIASCHYLQTTPSVILN